MGRTKKIPENENTEDSKTKKAKARLLKALEETSGIIAFACKKAKVSRMTFYRWCKEDKEFKEQADDIQELQVDVAEAALLSKIQQKETAAIIFYLKTKGKNRGYSERKEISGPDGGEIPVKKIDIKQLTPEERKALLRVAESANRSNE